MTADPSNAAPPRARFPIGLKLGLLATLLAVAPLSVVGFVLIDVNADAVESLSREVQLLALEDITRTVDQEIVEAQDALDMMGSLFADPSLDDATRMTVLRAMVTGQESVDHVALYDVEGNRVAVIAEEGLEHIEPPETLPEAMRAQIEQLHAATGPVERYGGEPRVPLAVRIRVDDRTTGYVLSLVDLEDVQQRVERLADGHFNGIENALLLVDRDLRTVAHPDRERAVSLASAEDEGILRDVDPALLGPRFSQSGEFDGADGEEMLGSAVGLTTQPWTAIAQVPQSIAYASITRMTRIVFLVVAIAIVLALLLGLLMARRISAPLGRLTHYATQLAERRFDARVDVSTSDELAVLAHSMNRAAEDLQASEAQLAKEAAIRGDLGRYLSPELVDQIVQRKADMDLGGRRRPVTVMFADVVGFTPLTEQLDPEHVVTILNELFTIQTDIIFRHGGTVDKFIGDCVMAMWGAPREHPDHARRALDAAEDMLSWLETGNERWEQQYGVTVQLAIGVHTGVAVVGNIGSEKRMEYTAIGDMVNVAARLEAMARPNQILVTEDVRRAAPDFDYADAAEHSLAGREQPIRLYEVQW